MRVRRMILGFGPQAAVLRRVFALAAILAASLAGLAQPLGASAAERFQVQVSAGYDGYARADDWTPVRVTVKNNGDDFRGVLQVDDASRSLGTVSTGFGGAAVPFGGGGSAAPVGFASRQLGVVIPAGSTRHYTTYVAGAQRPRATLLSGATPVASAEPSQTLTFTGPTTLLVGVVSDQADTLDQLALAGPSTGTTVHVVHFAAADVPASGILLRTFDALAFDDASTDALSGDQRAAVRDYVQAGGGLVLVGGPSARKTLAGIPPELQPVKPVATVTNDLHVVGGLVSVAAPSGGAEVSTGAAATGAHVISDGEVPILGWLQHGNGTVVYTAFDAGAEPLASWSGERAILRQLVARATGTPAATVFNGKGIGGPTTLGSRAGVTLDFGSISNVLSNLPSLDLPQLGLVGWLLFGYAVLVGPINYFVLKRMRRRHLAWLTIPAVVAISSSAVLLVGLSFKGVGTQVNQVRVVEMSPGSSRYYTVTYSGLVAAHRGDYTISLPDASFAGTAPSNNNPTVDDRVSIQGDPPTALLQGVTAYAIRTVAAEGYGDAEGSLDANLHLAASTASGSAANGPTVAGTVTNNTGRDLEDALVVYGGQYQLLGVIRAGQSENVSFHAGPAYQVNGGDVASSVYPNSNGNGSTTTDRQQQRRAQILRGIVGSGIGPGFQTGPPLLVAFSPSALRAPIVDGSPVKVEGEAVVVMAVQLLPDATISTLPVGDAAATLVDVDGDIQAQGFNGPSLPVLRVAGGSATYEFDLPGGGWKTAEVVASSATTALGCNTVLGPGPAPPPAQRGSSSGSATPATCIQPSLTAFNFNTAQWVVLKPGTSAIRFPVDVTGGLISAEGLVLVRYSTPAGAAGVVAAPEITAAKRATT